MKKFITGIVLLCVFSACEKEEREKNGELNGDNTLEETTYSIIEISTDHGEIYIWLYDETPLHKENFLELAKSGFYDSTTFHRVIKGFVIQGGDPLSKDGNPATDGTGGPGYTIEAEIVDSLTHTLGALAAARLGDVQNPQRRSSGSQFYIVENPNGAHGLDGAYTVFGTVIKGIETVHTIADQNTGARDRPFTNIYMRVQVLEKTADELLEEYDFEIQEDSAEE